MERTETSEAASSGRSNIDSFLECTTPTIHCQFLSKTSMREASSDWSWAQKTTQWIPFFILGDLWDSFDEWSAYGVGIPLSLPGQEMVQFYVPYLSAVQIYAQDSSDYCAAHRRLGGESDFSDVDFRETSSEGSLENESNMNVRKAAVPGFHGSHIVWDTATLCSEDSDEGFHEKNNNCGELLFEYFETFSPYGRAPLADKISELAYQFPKLKSLRSDELSPASWVSVAWYPIYGIPTGATTRGAATCFLTFHSLSTSSSQDHQNEDADGREDGGGLINGLEMRIRAHFKIDKERIVLPAFGLASYKLRGALWASVGQSERRHLWSLARCADSWLKHLNVRHPDFDFFVSRGCLARR